MQLPKFLQRFSQPDAKGDFYHRPLSSLVTKNLSLKVFALGMAVLMWGFVASQKRGESTEIKFTSPLVLKNIPPTLEAISSFNQNVTVLVQVRRDLARSINPNQFQVGIDLKNQLAGEFEYTLSDKNISYENDSLPQGITLLQISPSSIPLNLEGTIVKLVPIKPRFSGDLAPGFTIASIKINPPMAEVRGPGTKLSEIRNIPTRPLDVQDLKSDVEMEVGLDLPPMIRLASPKESFHRALITVSNNPTRALFLEIPIQFKKARYSYKASVSRINVHLEGPLSVMETVKKTDIKVVLDLSKFPPGDFRGLTPKVTVPEITKVLVQWPILDLFVLNRKIEQKTGTILNNKDKMSNKSKK